MKKTRVFLTGATGVMGTAGLKELIKFPENYDIKVLARDSRKNRKKLYPFQKRGVKVIWGDLLDENSIKEGVEDSDIILHVGGMVSPIADLYPEKTLKVNVGSMQLIASIVKKYEEKNPQYPKKVVYIGSVAEYGSKNPPNHWGNSGNELKAARNDAYAESKILAEKELIKANLKQWVSIRQTSILHSGLFKNASNPVVFHTPLQGVLEWITTEDSGRLLERICRPDVPVEFWCKAYNAGGGEEFRLVNIEFERKILKAIGCPPPEKIFEPNWFATDNFHGMWFEDSDKLDSILHYRLPDTFDKALERLKRSLPFYYQLARIVPSFVIKTYMKRVAKHPDLGPLTWIKRNDLDKIKNAWGSLENYNKIPDWKDFEEINLPKQKPVYLSEK